MARHISDTEHDKFLKEINSLPLNNQQIASKMAMDATRISHYRNGTKWPNKTTLKLFNREFRDNLDAIEKEARKRKVKEYEIPQESLSPADEDDQLRDYAINPNAFIDGHLKRIEYSVLALRKAMNIPSKSDGDQDSQEDDKKK